MTIVGVNDAVDARDDTFATGEDAPLSISTSGVLANDVDPDVNDKHTIIAVDVSPQRWASRSHPRLGRPDNPQCQRRPRL